MVAKLAGAHSQPKEGYLLAKIHMVAKLKEFHFVKHSPLSSSKNPYGSKTVVNIDLHADELSSSKNPYGSKTTQEPAFQACKLSSSKNPYGSKTVNL